MNAHMSHRLQHTCWSSNTCHMENAFANFKLRLQGRLGSNKLRRWWTWRMAGVLRSPVRPSGSACFRRLVRIPPESPAAARLCATAAAGLGFEARAAICPRERHKKRTKASKKPTQTISTAIGAGPKEIGAAPMRSFDRKPIFLERPFQRTTSSMTQFWNSPDLATSPLHIRLYQLTTSPNVTHIHLPRHQWPRPSTLPLPCSSLQGNALDL